MEIETGFPGGNIETIGRRGDVIELAPQMRDTEGDWFYWAFGVRGAQGKTLTFDFQGREILGYFGPAVSRDLRKWDWAGAKTLEGFSRFTYRFGPDEDLVYFAHSLLYQPDRFARLTEELALPVRALTRSEGGARVPIAQIGEGERLVLLTARHHCCESTGNYVLEGMLRALSARPIRGCRVAAVPFMDIDGVVRGDQGKNRRPHDHNRDYTAAPIYASTSALMRYAAGEPIACLIDLHSPWHFGGRNDTCFIVYNSRAQLEGYRRLGAILERMTADDPGSMAYDARNDIGVGVEWNTGESPTCARHFAGPGRAELSFTFETAYFGTPENPVGESRLIRLGACLAGALREYLERA